MKICVSYPVDVRYLIIYTKKNRANLFQCNDIFNSHELRLALNSSSEINFALPFSIFFPCFPFSLQHFFDEIAVSQYPFITLKQNKKRIISWACASDLL